jgi:hypothetical protein
MSSVNNFQEQILRLVETELRDQDQTSEQVYKHLIVLYLIEDETQKAKFLWKRIPAHLKSDAQSELRRVWLVAQNLIQRNYAQAFDHVNANKNIAWQSEELTRLFDLLVETSRERLFELVRVAYTSIGCHELAQMLGLSEQETSRIALSQGWSMDPTNESYLITPKKNCANLASSSTNNIIPNRTQMQQLTSLVSFLET